MIAQLSMTSSDDISKRYGLFPGHVTEGHLHRVSFKLEPTALFTEQLRLEGTSGDDPVQSSVFRIVSRMASVVSPGMETPQPL